jgi:putative mRNA 3-end processing factor
LVPAFALGRAQEIIEILVDAELGTPIYFDGMGQKVSKVYLQYPNYFKNAFDLRTAMDKVVSVKSQHQREELLKKQCIIVTTAGMVEGGPVLYYFKKMCSDSDNAIYLTGYQVQETKGDILLKERAIEVDGNLFEWKGDIKKFDFSAHVGQKNLLRVISAWNPELTVCVHGDVEVMKVYTKIINDDLGIKAIAPKNGEIIEYKKK